MDNERLIEVIGKNSGYYTKVFYDILAKNNNRKRDFKLAFFARPSINLAAFLVSFLGPFPFFFYYRKMYKVAFLLNIVYLLVVSLALANKIQIGAYVYHGVFMLFSLLYSNALYLSCIDKKLQKLALIASENRPQTVKNIGGVTYFIPIVMFIISAPSSIILTILTVYCKGSL